MIQNRGIDRQKITTAGLIAASQIGPPDAGPVCPRQNAPPVSRRYVLRSGGMAGQVAQGAFSTWVRAAACRRRRFCPARSQHPGSAHPGPEQVNPSFARIAQPGEQLRQLAAHPVWLYGPPTPKRVQLQHFAGQVLVQPDILTPTVLARVWRARLPWARSERMLIQIMQHQRAGDGGDQQILEPPADIAAGWTLSA